MTKNEIDKKIKIISDNLKACPLCGGKANIIGMHTILNDVVVDSVGCIKCNLSCEREKHILIDPNKIFSRTEKNIIEPVLTWNNRSKTLSL